jgi:hypothetical protein
MSPRSTVGDGNCAYRAVSLAGYGTEQHHTFVRLLAACEIIEHETTYDVQSGDCCLKDDRVLTSSYRSILNDALVDGQYAELLHLFAVSAALGVAFQSYVPPTAAVGHADSPYTVVVAGRGVRRTTTPAFTLMWSSAVS